jgi:hypothetical protein
MVGGGKENRLEDTNWNDGRQGEGNEQAEAKQRKVYSKKFSDSL